LTEEGICTVLPAMSAMVVGPADALCADRMAKKEAPMADKTITARIRAA